MITSDSSDDMDEADRRAHHNKLERQRRDNLKELFEELRSACPTLDGKKSSRLEILKTATAYLEEYHKKEKRLRHLVECKRQLDNFATNLNKCIKTKDRALFVKMLKEYKKKKHFIKDTLHPEAGNNSKTEDAPNEEAQELETETDTDDGEDSEAEDVDILD